MEKGDWQLVELEDILLLLRGRQLQWIEEGVAEAAYLAVGRRSAEDERVAAGAVRHAQLPNAIGQHLEGEGGVPLPPLHLLLLLLLLLLLFHHL
ncbi:hypothetical protein TYRP_009406 [Tyrophagus putrescentiae]|nr:hypothetical protein TYRP_009406 [Tyrophagus putrescentiae]